MSKKEEEINKSILEWLLAKNYTNAAEGLMTDANLTKEDATSGARLEKKWNAILILQKKVNDLEAQVKQLKEDLEAGGGGAGMAKKNAESMGLPKSLAKATIKGHRQPITCLAFHPVYKRLVSGSEDATIIVWECDEFSQEKSVKAHINTVNCVKFDASGVFLASCSSDTNIKIWKFDSMTCIKTLSGHEHTVSSIEFSLDGNFLYSASRDKTIKYWEVASGNCKSTWVGHEDWVRSVTLNEKGNILASCSDDEAIFVWQSDNGNLLKELRGHENKIEKVQFLTNTKSKENVITSDYLSSFTTRLMSSSEDIEKEETKDKSDEDKINEKFQAKAKLLKEKGTLMNKDYLLSASRDKTIKLWDIIGGVCIKTFHGHDNWVRDIIEHPNGKYFVSCSDDKSIRFWDLKSGLVAKKLADAHDRFVVCLSMSPKCKMLASGSNEKDIKIWDCS